MHVIPNDSAHTPLRRTEYTIVEEKIRTAGRGFGIFYELWRPYSSMIDKGLEACAADPSALPEGYVFDMFSPHTNSPCETEIEYMSTPSAISSASQSL
jgi:hypothetical protein